MKNQSLKDRAKQIIAEKAGIEVHEMTEDMFFGEDLNLGELELTEILEELEEEFKIDLIDEQDRIESVNNLLEILEEKLE